MKQKVAEKAVIRAVLHYLTLKRIWHRRMNSGGAMVSGHNGKGQFIRFGSPGLPDIMARTASGTIIWIECKSSTGKLSKDQEAWKKDALQFGDTFIVARGVDDVAALFEGRGVNVGV